MSKIDKKYIDIIKQWAKMEGIENIDFKIYDYDRGGVRIENLYKVFGDNRNFSVHIVFTAPDIFIKEGTYTIKELEKFSEVNYDNSNPNSR